MIQAAVRRRQEQERYQQTRRQCIKLQAGFRGCLARRLAARMRAAREIQRHVRGRIARKQMQEQQCAAVKVQASGATELAPLPA